MDLLKNLGKYDSKKPSIYQSNYSKEGYSKDIPKITPSSSSQIDIPAREGVKTWAETITQPVQLQKQVERGENSEEKYSEQPSSRLRACHSENNRKGTEIEETADKERERERETDFLLLLLLRRRVRRSAREEESSPLRRREDSRREENLIANTFHSPANFKPISSVYCQSQRGRNSWLSAGKRNTSRDSFHKPSPKTRGILPNLLPRGYLIILGHPSIF